MRAYAIAASVTAAEALLAFALPPYLQALDYPLGLIGLLVGLASGASLVSRLPAGFLYRGGRARLLLAAGTLVGGASTLLYLALTDPLGIALLRLLGGAAYGLATTVNLAWFVDRLPSGRDRAQAMGLYAGALATGFAIGNGPGGLLVDWFGFGAGFAFASALYGVGLALSVLGRSARGGASPAQAALAAAPGGPGVLGQLGAAVGDAGTRRVVVAAFLLAFLQQMLSAYLTLYALAVNVSLAEVGLIRTAFSVTQAVLRSTTTPVLRRLGRARAQHAGLVGQVVGIVVLGSVGGFWPLLAVTLAVGVCRAVAFVANTVGLAQEVDEGAVSRGVASGLFNAATDLGQILGPTVGGLVGQSFGLPATFHFVPPALLALYALAMLGGRGTRRWRAKA